MFGITVLRAGRMIEQYSCFVSSSLHLTERCSRVLLAKPRYDRACYRGRIPGISIYPRCTTFHLIQMKNGRAI
jgi:hypothetical protein